MLTLFAWRHFVDVFKGVSSVSTLLQSEAKLFKSFPSFPRHKGINVLRFGAEVSVFRDIQFMSAVGRFVHSMALLEQLEELFDRDARVR